MNSSVAATYRMWKRSASGLCIGQSYQAVHLCIVEGQRRTIRHAVAVEPGESDTVTSRSSGTSGGAGTESDCGNSTSMTNSYPMPMAFSIEAMTMDDTSSRRY